MEERLAKEKMDMSPTGMVALVAIKAGVARAVFKRAVLSKDLAITAQLVRCLLPPHVQQNDEGSQVGVFPPQTSVSRAPDVFARWAGATMTRTSCAGC